MVRTLVDLIHTPGWQDWSNRNEEAFRDIKKRYHKKAGESVQLRASDRNDVMFAAYIHASNPTAGRYGGTSFCICPAEDTPALVALIVGTAGLHPDDHILTRPGHARKCAAIAQWLNMEAQGEIVAWAKSDPANIDRSQFPNELAAQWGQHQKAIERYGGEMYLVFKPTENRDLTEMAITAILDLYFSERRVQPLKGATPGPDVYQKRYFACVNPDLTIDEVMRQLKDRRYVVLTGPPGTGKSHYATELVRGHYAGRGEVVQFHANTTYEDFVGGLAPSPDDGTVGLRFLPQPGVLMRAAVAARASDPSPYLLVIDEMNRADVAKVLGEAIYLLEVDAKPARSIRLAHDFELLGGRDLELPSNLHILATMNSADRSIATIDVAVRRRFAFLEMWPRPEVVAQYGGQLANEAFRRIFDIFVEYAREDQFAYAPGHSYFLERSDQKAIERLKVTLMPLLRDYLQQGLVAGFTEPVREFVAWLATRTS